MKIAFLTFALMFPMSVVAGVHHIKMISRVTVMPGPFGIIDHFLAGTATSLSGHLELLNSDEAYWHFEISGRTTYFFYAGKHSFRFQCRVTKVTGQNKKIVTTHKQEITKYLKGGVQYSALASIGLDGSCKVLLKANCLVPCDSIEQRVWRLRMARDSMKQLYQQLGA